MLSSHVTDSKHEARCVQSVLLVKAVTQRMAVWSKSVRDDKPRTRFRLSDKAIKFFWKKRANEKKKGGMMMLCARHDVCFISFSSSVRPRQFPHQRVSSRSFLSLLTFKPWVASVRSLNLDSKTNRRHRLFLQSLYIRFSTSKSYVYISDTPSMRWFWFVLIINDSDELFQTRLLPHCPSRHRCW